MHTDNSYWIVESYPIDAFIPGIDHVSRLGMLVVYCLDLNRVLAAGADTAASVLAALDSPSYQFCFR